MDQPVRVGLVFPRSGQQVFVSVPTHIARNIAARDTDYRTKSLETHSAVNASASHASK